MREGRPGRWEHRLTGTRAGHRALDALPTIHATLGVCARTVTAPTEAPPPPTCTSLVFFLPTMMGLTRWKCTRAIISLSAGWKKACLMLLRQQVAAGGRAGVGVLPPARAGQAGIHYCPGRQRSRRTAAAKSPFSPGWVGSLSSPAPSPLASSLAAAAPHQTINTTQQNPHTLHPHTPHSPVHDVQLLPLGRGVAEAVGMRLQRACHLATLAAKSGPDPHIGQSVHAALWVRKGGQGCHIVGSAGRGAGLARAGSGARPRHCQAGGAGTALVSSRLAARSVPLLR